MTFYVSQVRSADGEHKVGVIQKEWSGFAKEIFTDADNFGISFPLDLDVKIKAVLLGACLLIVRRFFFAVTLPVMGFLFPSTFMRCTILCFRISCTSKTPIGTKNGSP